MTPQAPENESLYDFMVDYLSLDFLCPECDERMWIGYTDGHVWNQCLDCNEPNINLDLAGYISNYPVPTDPLPDSIEVRDIGEYPHLLEHEKYYRKRIW